MAFVKDVKVHVKTASKPSQTVSRAMELKIADICTQAFAMPYVHLIQHQAQIKKIKSSLLASAVMMQLVSCVMQMTPVSVKDARLGSTYTTESVKAPVQEAGKKIRTAQRASCSQSMTWVSFRSHSLWQPLSAA